MAGAPPIDLEVRAFYGVVGIEKQFAEAKSGDWLYGDNAFLDRCRGTHFRFARNAYQISDLQRPGWERLRNLDVQIQPWRNGGRHVVIVEQSPHFLGLVGAPGWLAETLATLQRATERPLRVRRWNRDKGGAARTLAADLVDAWALVTHSSAAANEAIIAGVPAFVTGACAASTMALSDLSQIESPTYPDARLWWLAGLANSQWTLPELRDGTAWGRIW